MMIPNSFKVISEKPQVNQVVPYNKPLIPFVVINEFNPSICIFFSATKCHHLFIIGKAKERHCTKQNKKPFIKNSSPQSA